MKMDTYGPYRSRINQVLQRTRVAFFQEDPVSTILSFRAPKSCLQHYRQPQFSTLPQRLRSSRSFHTADDEASVSSFESLSSNEFLIRRSESVRGTNDSKFLSTGPNGFEQRNVSHVQTGSTSPADGKSKVSTPAESLETFPSSHSRDTDVQSKQQIASEYRLHDEHISSLLALAYSSHIPKEKTLRILEKLAPCLERILRKFPLRSSIRNPLLAEKLHFEYVLERVINWGAHGVVFRASVQLCFPSKPSSHTLSPKTNGITSHTVVHEFGDGLHGLTHKNKLLIPPRFLENRKEHMAGPQTHILRVSKNQPERSPSTADLATKEALPMTKRPLGLGGFARFFRSLRQQQQRSDLSLSFIEPSLDGNIHCYDMNVTESEVGVQKSQYLEGLGISTGMTVAVKIVDVDHVELNVEQNELERVCLEAALLAVADHPSVSEFVESFSLPPSFCIIVQEFLVGSVCRLYQDFGPLPEPVIAFIVYDVLTALASLHGGIGGKESLCVHRDVKASNILLSHAAVSKLVDFGVATMMPRGAFSQVYVGTPHYMAPEVAAEHGVDCKADIWSLGITCLEMATAGLPPEFKQKTEDEPTLQDGHFPAGRLSTKRTINAKFAQDEEIDAAITAQAVEMNEQEFNDVSGSVKMVEISFSPDLKDFIDRCLERDPLRRPSAQELLKHPFLDFQQRFSSYKELFIHLLKSAYGRHKVEKSRIVMSATPRTSQSRSSKVTSECQTSNRFGITDTHTNCTPTTQCADDKDSRFKRDWYVSKNSQEQIDSGTDSIGSKEKTRYPSISQLVKRFARGFSNSFMTMDFRGTQKNKTDNDRIVEDTFEETQSIIENQSCYESGPRFSNSAIEPSNHKETANELIEPAYPYITMTKAKFVTVSSFNSEAPFAIESKVKEDRGQS